MAATHNADLVLIPMQLRSLIPAFVVLVLSLTTAVLAALTVRKDVQALERRQFLLEAALVKEAVVDAMTTYELALRAGAGLFRSAGEVPKEQWRIFVQALDLERQYPGFQGIGYTAAVQPARLASFEQQQRTNGNAGFVVKPPGNRELYTAIVLLEPQDGRNHRAIGFDMFSEPNRRAAMERARDTGDTALTAKVTLVQETDQAVQAGTLMYLPVYSQGPPPITLEDRRARLRGFTYGAFRMDDLINAVMRTQAPDALKHFHLVVYDGDRADPASQLFDNMKAPPSSKQPLGAEYPLAIAGRTWTLGVSGAAPIQNIVDKGKPMLVLTGGVIISLLIAAITAFQAMARHDLAASRQALAEEVAQRKRAQEAAEMANGELIHRVKNTLAIVSAIASQTIRYSATLEDFSRAFRERLASLARVQDLLQTASGPVEQLDLEQLVRQMLEPYTQKNEQKIKLQGPPVGVSKNDVVLFSLTFNELATNATKYGAWSQPEGTVELRWHMEEFDQDQQLVLVWEEGGGPSTSAPQKKGFGSAVMQFAIQRAMHGTIVSEYRTQGLRCEIRLPRGTGRQAAAA